MMNLYQVHVGYFQGQTLTVRLQRVSAFSPIVWQNTFKVYEIFKFLLDKLLILNSLSAYLFSF